MKNYTIKLSSDDGASKTVMTEKLTFQEAFVIANTEQSRLGFDWRILNIKEETRRSRN